jgi:predicted nucleic acid-binding protein
LEARRTLVIVVDTNIICYRCMASPYANAADAAWRRDPHWIAPTLWRSEFRNALAGALRQRSLTIESALEIANLAETIMAGNEFLVSSPAILRLVAASRCSAYDCEFIALAEEHRVPLLTVDRQLLRSFPRVAIALEKFVR